MTLNLESKFQNKIEELIPKNAKVLVACSGGLDSMALVYLLLKCKIEIGIAHVNYGLRLFESDEEETFVKKTAANLSVPIFTLNHKDFSSVEPKTNNTQIWAREIRYNFFREISAKEDFDYIATAHHADDQAETILMNMGRGSGLNGLKGIPEKDNNIIRPLLYFTRGELKNWMTKNHYSWKTDSSNLSPKYTRNKLRLELIPALNALIPSFSEHLSDVGKWAKESNELLDFLIAKNFKHSPQSEYVFISFESLNSFPLSETLLFKLLNPFGFNNANTLKILLDLIKSDGFGQKFESNSHTLFFERKGLHLKKNTLKEKIQIEVDSETSKLETAFGTFAFEKVNSLTIEINNLSKNEIALDLDKITFPLTIRSWESGDKIKPLGLKGTKKVSDCLNEARIDQHLKENYPVLISENDILWIPNIRVSEKGKIRSKTKNILRITWKNF